MVAGGLAKAGLEKNYGIVGGEFRQDILVEK
jgi:hypothetical protein